MELNIDIDNIEPKSEQHREILKDLPKHVESMMDQVLLNFPNLSEEKRNDVKKQIIEKLVSGESLDNIEILV